MIQDVQWDDNYCTFGWIDNSIVKMVSNIHTGTSSDVSILKNKGKQQINEFNRNHVRLI